MNKQLIKRITIAYSLFTCFCAMGSDLPDMPIDQLRMLHESAEIDLYRDVRGLERQLKKADHAVVTSKVTDAADVTELSILSARLSTYKKAIAQFEEAQASARAAALAEQERLQEQLIERQRAAQRSARWQQRSASGSGFGPGEEYHSSLSAAIRPIMRSAPAAVVDGQAREKIQQALITIATEKDTLNRKMDNFAEAAAAGDDFARGIIRELRQKIATLEREQALWEKKLQ